MAHDPAYEPCRLSELACERCGNTTDRHVGTHRSPAGYAHWCWPCLRELDGAKTLHELNEERKRAAWPNDRPLSAIPDDRWTCELRRR